MASVLFCFDKWLLPSDFRRRNYRPYRLPSQSALRRSKKAFENFWKMASVLFCFDKWLLSSDFRRRNYRPYRLFWLVRCRYSRFVKWLSPSDFLRLFWLVRWYWRRLHRLYRLWPVGQLSSTMLHFNQAKQFKFQLFYILQCLSSKMLLLSRTINKPSFNVTVCSTRTT